MGGLPNELISIHSYPRGVVNRRPWIEHIMWGRRTAWSSLWRLPCSCILLTRHFANLAVGLCFVTAVMATNKTAYRLEDCAKCDATQCHPAVLVANWMQFFEAKDQKCLITCTTKYNQVPSQSDQNCQHFRNQLSGYRESNCGRNLIHNRHTNVVCRGLEAATKDHQGLPVDIFWIG